MKPLTGCSKSADTDKIQGNQPMKGGTPVRTLYMRDHATDRQPATVIHDENNQAAYLLAGKWGLRQDALSLYNMRGDLLAEVSQLSLGLLPKFALYVNHQKVGVVGLCAGSRLHPGLELGHCRQCPHQSLPRLQGQPPGLCHGTRR